MDFFVVADAAGNAYVTGFTDSPDFPVTPGAFQATLKGEQDAFITKLNTVVIPHPIPTPPRSRGISIEILTQFTEVQKISLEDS